MGVTSHCRVSTYYQGTDATRRPGHGDASWRFAQEAFIHSKLSGAGPPGQENLDLNQCLSLQNAAKAADASEPHCLLRYGHHRDLTELVIAQPEAEVLKPNGPNQKMSTLGRQAFVASNPSEYR